MGKLCLWCGDALDIDAEFGRRNFCRYKSPNCNTEYNNLIRSITKATNHPDQRVQELARLLTEREPKPLKPIKDDWLLLTRKHKPDKELISKFNNTVQVIYERSDKNLNCKVRNQS